MTPRRRRVTAAVVLAVYLVFSAVALALVLEAPIAAAPLRTLASLVVGAARSAGLLTLSDGFLQAMAVSIAVVPVLPLLTTAVVPRWRAAASGLAVVAVGLACLVVSSSTNEGGAGALAGRVTSLLLAAAVGLALSALVEAAVEAAVRARSMTDVAARRPRIQRLAIWAGAFYVAIVAVVAFAARPVESGFASALDQVLARAHEFGLPPWVDYSVVEFSANVAFFVPVGIVVVLLAGMHHWWWGVAVGALLSTGVEFGQLLFLPDRFATPDDVLANTSGAFIGSLVGLAFLGHADHQLSPIQDVRRNGSPPTRP